MALIAASVPDAAGGMAARQSEAEGEADRHPQGGAAARAGHLLQRTSGRGVGRAASWTRGWLAKASYRELARELSCAGWRCCRIRSRGLPMTPRATPPPICRPTWISVAVQLRRTWARGEGADHAGRPGDALGAWGRRGHRRFLRGWGRILTPGRKAIAAATWGFGGIAGEFHGELAFVDSKTGEVLASVRFLRQRDITKKTDERFAENLREVLHDIPFPVPPRKASHHHFGFFAFCVFNSCRALPGRTCRRACSVQTGKRFR